MSEKPTSNPSPQNATPKLPDVPANRIVKGGDVSAPRIKANNS